MADIFIQDIESSEENSNEQPKILETNSKEPTVEEPDDKSSSETTKGSDEMDVIEIDNIHFYQSQIEQLEELATSDYIQNRQNAAKKILPSLQIAGSDKDELQSIVSVMCKLSEDEEGLVRCELVQHIPSIALFCHSAGLQLVIQQQLVPYTVKLLNDPQIQVRKLAQSALIVLLENNLIGELQLSEWICPLIAQLAICESNQEEQRIEDVTVMSIMVPLVNRELALKFFLEPYVKLCCDEVFGVRTVCAMRFGTLCEVAGRETTEFSLLPAFLNLCCDELWGVRKACADVFVDVANVVSLKTRKEVLPHIFINLFNDASRFVEHAAIQALGGFISTFADPSKTGCHYKNGQIHIDESFHQVTSNTPSNETKPHDTPHPSISLRYLPANQSVLSIHAPIDSDNNNLPFVNDEREEGFGTFLYWRTPIPDLLDNDLAESLSRMALEDLDEREAVPPLDCADSCLVNFNEEGENNINTRSNLRIQPWKKRLESARRWRSNNSETVSNQSLQESKMSERERSLVISNGIFGSNKIDTLNTTPLLNAEPTEKRKCELITAEDQDIVPPQLLSKYTFIVEYDYTEKAIESCAYSFPAVALTLGRRYWPCIVDTCRKIAQDVRWTVRLPIASSLHMLARMLGQEITCRDLLPLFLEYVSDTDEVKMSMMTHLHHFLEQLSVEKRRCFLDSIEDFSSYHFARNWRFRCALAEHFQPVSLLYSTSEVHKYFVPIAFALLQDRVFAVRLKATEFAAHIIKLLHEDSISNYCEQLVTDLITKLGEGKKWISRQTFVFSCEQLARQQALSPMEYAERVLPPLRHLATDPVPNVRLALARCVVGTLGPHRKVFLEHEEHGIQLLSIVEILKEDVDADVRHVACRWHCSSEGGDCC